MFGNAIMSRDAKVTGSTTLAVPTLSSLLLMVCLWLMAGVGPAAAASGAGSGPVADASEVEVRIADVRESLAAGDLRAAYVTADSLRRAGVQATDLVRLEGDILWLAGSARALAVADTLRARGEVLAADVLLLKVDLLLGRPQVAARLEELAASAPGDPDLRLLRWLLTLDGGSWQEALRQVDGVADGVTCAYIPPTALMLAAIDIDSTSAATAAAVMRRRNCNRLETLRRKVAAGALFSGPCGIVGTRELPYVACGPYMGMRLTASDGRQVTVTLDTGTGSGLLTLHSQEAGDALPGPEILRLENAIHYNYMAAPADIVVKRVDFADPPLIGRPVEYFAGSLDGSDGCASPFAFPDVAVTVDAAAERIWLRDRGDLEAYVASLPPDASAVVPFIRRGGWIFVPVRLNGHEVLMMLESGSRDVNVHALAARRLGIETYRSTSVWQGQEREVTRADLTVEIGGLVHHCPDGFVEAGVLGNNLTGLAGAGDVGPEFLRRYRWTIDPFAERLILESYQ